MYSTQYCTWQVALSHKMHAFSSIGASVPHEPFPQGSQGFSVLWTLEGLPQMSGRPPATSWCLPSSPDAHFLLIKIIKQSQMASAGPCARAPGAPWGVAAAGLWALRPAKHRLHVARIKRHPPFVDPARAQGRARAAAGPLIQPRPAKGSCGRGLPRTIVSSVLGTPARFVLRARVHLLHLALHTFLGEGCDCWPAAQHHSYEAIGYQLQSKDFAEQFSAHTTEAGRRPH